MKYILLFEELFIQSNKSGSGKTTEWDNILDDPTSSKSLSSSILLRNKLQKDEWKSTVKSIGGETKKLKPKPNNRKIEKLKVSLHNLKFLKDKLKERGALRCEYCNNGPLIIYDTFYKGSDQKYLKHKPFSNIDGATADHKNPQSKGGDKYSQDNLAVACMKCNHDKKDMDYEDWIEIIKTKQ